MLRHTFIHIPGVGVRTERKLWNRGACTWEDAVKLISGSANGLGSAAHRLETYIPETFRALKDRDSGFFDRLTRHGESWRMFSEFPDECVYVDIETTGLSPRQDEITMVGTFNGSDYKAFVKGQNLRELGHELKKYPIAVTFNGSGFDLPFLRRRFSSSLPPAHIDLRWTAYKLGFRGGLKEIEPKFGVKRPKRLSNMDGFDAIILWNQYRHGDRYALERLIDYNRADVVGLKTIMKQCYVRLVAQNERFFPKAQRRFASVN
jgi:hypothetical protein